MGKRYGKKKKCWAKTRLRIKTNARWSLKRKLLLSNKGLEKRKGAFEIGLKGWIEKKRKNKRER